MTTETSLKISGTDKVEASCGEGETSFRGKRIHFIGVGGCGMRALANAMLNHGAIVSGSDISPGGCLQMLERQGVRCWSGHDASQLTEPVDFAVASAAINENNPELVRLRQDGVKIYKYAQMLGMLMDKHTGVAISGTHGKSTTSAMTAYVLRRAGLDPSFVVGANVDQLSGASGVGRGEFFVAEACEFDRSFLNLRPTLAAILNVEEDHLDCYGDINQIISAFEAFAGQVRPGGLLIVNGEDDNIAKFVHRLRIPVETFGLDKACCWRADDLVMIDGCYAFDLLYRDKVLGRCKLEIPGRHNVLNALASAALCYHCRMEPAEICQGLSEFRGANRRLMLKGSAGGVTVLDDYAHHPTEVRASLRAVREKFSPRRLWCVFQPHQHSRTRFLLDDFARSFADADVVVVPKIYFVRDSETERHLINSGDLVARIDQLGGTACHLPRLDQIVDYLKGQLAPGDLVITMGAGDIWKIADELICWLGRDRN